jgi:hypothetical protein
MQRVREQFPELDVIVITGFSSVGSAVDCMRLGAYDYVPKPFDAESLRLAVGRALEKRRLALENLALRRSQPSPPYIIAKVGGPYLRSSFVRGEVNWLMDMAEDPGFVDALATRMADHLIAVGLESLQRGNLWQGVGNEIMPSGRMMTGRETSGTRRTSTSIWSPGHKTYSLR